MNRSRAASLIADCSKIKSNANRKAIDLIISEAMDNAYYSIDVEKAAPPEDWDRIFVGSIGCLLSGGEYSKAVVKFFDARGISY